MSRGVQGYIRSARGDRDFQEKIFSVVYGEQDLSGVCSTRTVYLVRSLCVSDVGWITTVTFGKGQG